MRRQRVADQRIDKGVRHVGRTAGLAFGSERSAPFPRNLISGQRRLRVYGGSGRALVCWTPYWNEHMHQQMTGRSVEGSLFV